MIKIPHNRAVEILRDRLEDVDVVNVDLEALKGRIQADVHAIFGRGTPQMISSITLKTPYRYDDSKSIDECKKGFKQTIQGFISFIEDFHKIQLEQFEASEETYREKFTSLLERWNELIPQYNQLLEDYEGTVKKYDTALSRIRQLTVKLKEEALLPGVTKILFLSASPMDEDRLRVDEEVREIEAKLTTAALRDQFELKQKTALTSKTLQQAFLSEKASIVHFSGHGGATGIAVEDVLGNSKIIDNSAICSLFELFTDTIKCVVLNSCYSESQAKEISKHVPYVVGMTSSVSDESAIAFSVGFYAALGAGKDCPFAFKMGLVGMRMEGVNENDLPILLG